MPRTLPSFEAGRQRGGFLHALGKPWRMLKGLWTLVRENLATQTPRRLEFRARHRRQEGQGGTVTVGRATANACTSTRAAPRAPHTPCRAITS